MNENQTCQHDTSDQAIVRDEDGKLALVWCKGCGEELF